MQIRQATVNDIEQIAQLERQHLNDELSSNSAAMSGQGYSVNDLQQILRQGWIVVAETNSTTNSAIIGYVFAGPWAFFTQFSIYKHIVKQLRHIDFNGTSLTEKNSCQYGPIWIASSSRGQGIFEKLVDKIRQLSRQKYSHMVTFIAEENQHSYFAHTRKGQMQVIDFFDYADRGYYLLRG